MTWFAGVYEGYWKDGNRNGHGKSVWNNGNIYEGEYKDGNKLGRGVKTWADGRVEDGGTVEERQVYSVVV